jgi:hypothetical protein
LGTIYDEEEDEHLYKYVKWWNFFTYMLCEKHITLNSRKIHEEWIFYSAQCKVFTAKHIV